MKNRFRFLALVLALLSACTVLASCRKKEISVYVNQIVCNEYSYSTDGKFTKKTEVHTFEKKNSEGENYVTLTYEEGLQVKLYPQGFPYNATVLSEKKPYIFQSQSSCATVNDEGIITFTKAGTVIIHIYPADGGDVSTTVIVRAKEVN